MVTLGTQPGWRPQKTAFGKNVAFHQLLKPCFNINHKCTAEPPTVAVQSSASEVHCEMSALPFRIKNSEKHTMQVFHCRRFAGAIWQHKLMCCGVPQGESAEPLKAATVPLAIGNCKMKIGDNDRQ